jgi:ketosteroid isomerase-like protein
MMHKYWVATLFNVVAILGVATFALADEEADHAALRRLVEEYETAVQKADPSLLEPYLAPGFTGVMVTGQEANSFHALDEYWNRIQSLLGEGGKYSVKINVPQPATIVGDVAYAHGTTEDTAVTSAGKEYKFQGFWTAICRREADGWKIVRVHGSMDAISNTFVKSTLRSATMLAAGAGGAAGVVIGAILTWFVRSRRAAPVQVA